ncbi:MAG: radical SAM protein [Deltaproteobacteria bacterium]|nr:radical SAM protein [Deltaproteobacteria bacterium]
MVTPRERLASARPTLDDQLAVLKIQRTCVHDGPGIRTNVFFRGCAMRCRWCQNPEAQAFERAAGGPRLVDILATIRQDAPYYSRTHGGVTLSGGEPLLQHLPSLLRLLQALGEEDLPVAVETAGHAPWKAYQAVLPQTGLFLYDLKLVESEARHLEATRTRLQPVIDNLRRLVDAGARVQLRMCVVPGINDDESNLRATAALVRSVGVGAIELLRFHSAYEAKAKKLGIPHEALGITAEQSAAALARATRRLADEGLDVRAAQAPAARPAPAFTRRVLDIRKDIRAAGYSVCMESARLKTAFYRRHGFRQPVKVQRAELLRYLLGNKEVTIHPHELLVGNFTSKRVGGSVWAELFGSVGILNLHGADRQKPVSFRCSLADKLEFYLRIVPFWARHSLISKVYPSLKDLGWFTAKALGKRVAFLNNFSGVAHFIINHEPYLERGTRGMIADARARQRENPGHDDFYESVVISLTALEEFAARYARRLGELARLERDEARRGELESMADICRRVPAHPARTFHEALQSILFMMIALCTETFENAISFGRLDQVLFPYYQRDLAAGRITRDRARELLALFVLKIDELIFLSDGESGLQFGKLFESLSPVETITIGGVDGEGRDATNDLTYLILDGCELRPISANMAARIHQGSPSEYVERIAEVYLGGSPMPELFSDEVYVPALQRHYPSRLDEARNYSIVGCVEPVASRDHFGNTDCANINLTIPFVRALRGDERPMWRWGLLEGIDRKLLYSAADRLGLMWLLRWDRAPAHQRAARSMAELMARFEARTREVTRAVLHDHALIEAALCREFSTPLTSALYEGCMRSGRCVYEGGTSINTSGIQGIGVTDVADSLCAIDEVVFRRRFCSMNDLLDALAANFEGSWYQAIRAELLAAPKFGDDQAPETQRWMGRVLEVWTGALAATPHLPRGGKYVAGYYGLNVNLVYGKRTPPLPSGRLRGVPLANSLVPHYGMEAQDLTSALNSIARLDFPRFAPNGTTVTSTIDPGLFPGEEGVRNLAAIIRGYFGQGGMQFQPNIVSRETLVDAYLHPGTHPDLVVRIAGYCAHFDDLTDDLKREIIDRTYYSSAA